ncbi:MAG TPA: type II toxin-antitoxin system VapC family toxin [Mucilaginibacter sp.]|jgi:predicted nucleic acid-binding protein|nr:type II toxin-antitoxin system VapC family toxin [Mucilaginibacter sp.]
MSGTDIFLDTNICIYLLNGDTILAELLQEQNLYLSVITEIELYSYHSNSALAIQVLNNFFQSVTIINIEEKVKAKTIEIRKNFKLKLPDSIIAASALTYNLPFITADKGFRKIELIDLILYDNI